ncbi:T9SS type A sorting domain-containing protein [Lacibacter luteus]|nr:T9SS type A sorting domain-containing protein [Lacibacter luteus]
MKQLLTTVLSCFFVTVQAAQYNVTIVGTAYSPSTVTVNVGDQVIIEASGSHPLLQVSQASWDANEATQLSGGFSSTSNYTLTITAGMAGTTIYYGCSAHFSSGMKGQIVVNVVSGISENNVRDFNFTVYPNPVSADAWINIYLKKSERVSIQVYDLAGRIVHTFIDQQMKAGELTMSFSLTNLAKGNYIVQMRNGNERMQKQIVIR